jgi:hypothetical protein
LGCGRHAHGDAAAEWELGQAGLFAGRGVANAATDFLFRVAGLLFVLSLVPKEEIRENLNGCQRRFYDRKK